MTINLLNKTDRFIQLKTLRAKLEELGHIENVMNFCPLCGFESRFRLIDQALALSDPNTHAYYGDPVNDTYSDGFMSITGIDNLISDVNNFITDCSKYIPGGQEIK